MRLLRTIPAGERDPETLVAFCDKLIRTKKHDQVVAPPLRDTTARSICMSWPTGNINTNLLCGLLRFLTSPKKPALRSFNAVGNVVMRINTIFKVTGH